MIRRGMSANNGGIRNEDLGRLIATSTSLFLTFLRKFRRNFHHFTHHHGVVSMLYLGKIRPFTMLRVRRISSIRLTPFKRFSRLLIFLMVVMGFDNGYQGFMIVSRRHGTLNAVLTSRQFCSTRHLATTQDSSCPYSSRAITCQRPSLTGFAFMVMPRQCVRTVLILGLLFTLLRAFVLGIRPIFARSLLSRLQSIVRYSVCRCRASGHNHRMRSSV